MADRYIERIQEMWPDTPETAVQSLAHTLDVFVHEPDEMQVITATRGIYPEATGLTLGDLRELKKTLDQHGRK